MSQTSHATNAMSHTSHATNAMYAMYAINARKSDVDDCPAFWILFVEKAGLKVCPKCFFMTTVNRFIFYFIFLPSHKNRIEKRDSFYTAKRVSSRLPIGVKRTVFVSTGTKKITALFNGVGLNKNFLGYTRGVLEYFRSRTNYSFHIPRTPVPPAAPRQQYRWDQYAIGRIRNFFQWVKRVCWQFCWRVCSIAGNLS